MRHRAPLNPRTRGADCHSSPASQAISAERTLAETAARALAFLSGVSTSVSIRAALAQRGYTRKVHDRFWQLLLETSGFRPARHAADEQARSAMTELQRWEELTFRVAQVALRYDHPEVHAFLFEGLDTEQGAGALIAVTHWLDRLDALEKGPERKATRKADHAALAKLAERGITLEERERVRQLVTVARTAVDEAADEEGGDAEAGSDEVRQKLLALRAMYEEWAELARLLVKRRSDLIRLGLAKRRRAKDSDGDDETSAPRPAAARPVLSAPPPSVRELPPSQRPLGSLPAPTVAEPRPS